jgi:FixJ family two-component response regulator
MITQDAAVVVAVVEDDASARKALGRLLEAGGFEPALFDSAEAFIETPPLTAPLCLILDVQLGGMSGIDLQRRLRREGSDLPIIVTTGLREDSIRSLAEKNGCAGFLFKPFNADRLLALIASISRQARPLDVVSGL